MVLWAEIAQLLGALMPVTPLPAHWWGPLLGNGAFAATDWDWEQMQPHHTLCVPPRSPSHYTLTCPPARTPILPYLLPPTHQAFVLILQAPSLIKYKLQQCFGLDYHQS